jgi:preprotein translocase subunit SecD
MSNLKYRLLLIAALIVASAWTLYPREVTTRVRDKDGILRTEKTKLVPLRRGLDLQGGMYLALEVDDSKQAVADKAEAIDLALTTVRTRIEGIGVSETVVQKSGTDRIIVQIPGVTDPERARKLVEDVAFLEFLITDETGALEKVRGRFDQILKDKGPALALLTGDKVAEKPGDAPQAKTLEGLLTKADTGAKRDTTQKPKTAADSAKADSLANLGKAPGLFSSLVLASPFGMPGEYLVELEKEGTLETYLSLPEIKAAMPPGKQILFGRDTISQNGTLYRWFYVTDTRPIIDGTALTGAQPGTDPQNGQTIVSFELSNAGGRRFGSETAKHIQDNMAIVLDRRVMGRPPVIQSVIRNRGQITLGGRDLLAAQDLALVLRAGSLPVPLRVVETRSIGPSMGKDSINKGLAAGALAIALIILVMVGYYRFSGVLAIAGLVIYVLYTAAMLAGFGAVVTLPGLAGFVLSIAIAVDANVLIFERIREELARGKTVRTAIDEGFRHAMPAIIDSNISAILTAAVLYQFGTGPVKGFAVTLIAGVVASLVTAIFVVRTFYLMWLNRARGAQTLSI